MRPEERAREVAQDIGLEHSTCDDSCTHWHETTGKIAAAIRAAVEEEREACAKICDEEDLVNKGLDADGYASACAERIRTRGSTNPHGPSQAEPDDVARGKPLGAELIEACEDVLEQERGKNEKTNR